MYLPEWPAWNHLKDHFGKGKDVFRRTQGNVIQMACKSIKNPKKYTAIHSPDEYSTDSDLFDTVEEAKEWCNKKLSNFLYGG